MSNTLPSIQKFWMLQRHLVGLFSDLQEISFAILVHVFRDTTLSQCLKYMREKSWSSEW